MKRFLNTITDRLSDAALLETGVSATLNEAATEEAHETLEENLIEIAFAEAADYDDIHSAIQREHEEEKNNTLRKACWYGNNNRCFRNAA